MPPRSPLPALRAILKTCTVTRTTNPALAHVAVLPEGATGTVLRATDTDTCASLHLPATVAAPLAGVAGPIGLPVGLVLSALDGHSLPTGHPTFPVIDLPPVPDAPADGWIDAATLLPALGRVARFASSDDARSGLNGIHCETAGDTIRFAATDGHRLHVEAPGKGSLPGALLPTAWCSLVARLPWESVRIAVADGTCWARGTLPAGIRASIGGRVLDGDFPDWTQVVPAGVQREATFPAAELLPVLADVVRLLRGGTPIVTLDIDPDAAVPSARFRAGNADTGIVAHTLLWQGNGRALKIGFNARFLTDAIKAVTEGTGGESVLLGMGDCLSPCLVIGPDPSRLSVVMPVRFD